VTRVEVRRTYLAVDSRRQLVAAHSDDARLGLARLGPEDAAAYRALYAGVGGPYHWFERRAWGDDVLRAHLARPEIEVDVLTCEGEHVGFFELESHEDGSREVVYFGVLPALHGHGFGKHLLSVAVERAFALGASRVWLHTCSLDAPAALPNYERRGFRAYRWEIAEVDVPECE